MFIFTRQILSAKSEGKGLILLESFPFVNLNGFLYSVLCFCYYSPYTGRLTPTTPLVDQYNPTTPLVEQYNTSIQCGHIEICMKEFGSLYPPPPPSNFVCGGYTVFTLSVRALVCQLGANSIRVISLCSSNWLFI